MLNRPSFVTFLPFIFLSLLAFGAATAVGVCVAGALSVAAFGGICRRLAIRLASHKSLPL